MNIKAVDLFLDGNNDVAQHGILRIVRKYVVRHLLLGEVRQQLYKLGSLDAQTLSRGGQQDVQFMHGLLVPLPLALLHYHYVLNWELIYASSGVAVLFCKRPADIVSRDLGIFDVS